MDIERKIASAAGRGKADVLFCNARVVSVFSGEIQHLDVAVKDGRFCGFGAYDADKRLDVKGMYMVPGLIDAHVHIESAMTVPEEFAAAVLCCGTTTCVADPHEIANVAGVEGIEYMIAASRNQIMNMLFAMPSCVPATDMETSGARLGSRETEKLITHPAMVALGEMMNYPGVIFQDPEVLRKIAAAHTAGKPVDGHAPGVSGRDLYAYAAAGISSDHECTTLAEAVEKLRVGMHIMIREGTGAKNLDELLPAVNSDTLGRIMWCTDDCHPGEILSRGHVDHIIRKAIKAGLDPVQAIRIGTLNPAEYFRLPDAGAIAPGRRADFILTENLETFRIDQVWCKGVLASEKGKYSAGTGAGLKGAYPEVMNIKTADLDFSIPDREGMIRAIGIVPGQIVTENLKMTPGRENDFAKADPSRDLAKIVVVERYSGKTGTGKGFVHGLGLLKGAIASSVAHDSHNIVAAGTNDRDMIKAVTEVVEMKGGMTVVCNDRVTASLPLPVAGLMSDRPMHEVRDMMDKVVTAAKDLGSRLEDPFMTLGFLALPVIPRLKITDRGIVDVEKFRVVKLFAEKDEK